MNAQIEEHVSDSAFYPWTHLPG